MTETTTIYLKELKIVHDLFAPEDFFSQAVALISGATLIALHCLFKEEYKAIRPFIVIGKLTLPHNRGKPHENQAKVLSEKDHFE